MVLDEALCASSLRTALLVLQEENEFITATESGSYRIFDYRGTHIFTYPLESARFQETHIFRDHQYIDTRAPESNLWIPLEPDMEGVPQWGRQTLLAI